MSENTPDESISAARNNTDPPAAPTSATGGRTRKRAANAEQSEGASTGGNSAESASVKKAPPKKAATTVKKAPPKAAKTTAARKATTKSSQPETHPAALAPQFTAPTFSSGGASNSESAARHTASARKPRRATKAAGAPTSADAATSSGMPTTGGTVHNASLDVFAELNAHSPRQTADTEKPALPQLSTSAIIFQAPDPETIQPRRRRASPSGQATSTPETEGETAQGSETAADAVKEQDERADNEGSDAAESDSAKRRRRRGGRGKRGKSSDATGSGDSDSDTDNSGSSKSGSVERSQQGIAERSKSASTERSKATPAEQRTDDADSDAASTEADGPDESGSSRRRRRRRSTSDSESSRSQNKSDEVVALKGSTRLEAKRQRRREGRDAGRRRTAITEAEFLARREAVERSMIVREHDSRTQIAVLEDGVLVEHYVSRKTQATMAGNIYLGRVQNVLPSMEAAFVDIGKGRNAVLYAGEVNWDAAGMENGSRKIEDALKSGDTVLVQVTKDPIGHKGARLTSQISLAGRYLVYVPGGSMTGISRKLPDSERTRLKKILKEVVPDSAGVIVRTAAEGASEDELRKDVARLGAQWEEVEKAAAKGNAPMLLQGEPDLAIRVIRDVFNEDFSSLVVSGKEAWRTISDYVGQVAPDLTERMSKWTKENDVFAEYRIDEQLTKGMDRKVWLPSGGSLIIDRTEAMTVVDVNTGKFTGTGGTLEETVTRNNLEAAEEIVRQLRLRDIGGIIVIDFIDMVLESNRDLVLRRLVECLGRDRTKHQVAEVTSLGLVQMTRKRVGQGLVEAFSEPCECCNGRGFIVHSQPFEKSSGPKSDSADKADKGGEKQSAATKRSRRKKSGSKPAEDSDTSDDESRVNVKAALATIAAAAAQSHDKQEGEGGEAGASAESVSTPADEAPAVMPEGEATGVGGRVVASDINDVRHAALVAVDSAKLPVTVRGDVASSPGEQNDEAEITPDVDNATPGHSDKANAATPAEATAPAPSDDTADANGETKPEDEGEAV